ncbi:DUF4190 domain-containing protein [Streptomyces odontomachi]|uniref:DUF4190 domain-containing protein n=1 Tax=Streptomyces odontomachi TaxID=2944940 RepID=UPI00210D8723|nr:DUF4190 domain-containing protein [Streptomyces sp. ODS25]
MANWDAPASPAWQESPQPEAPRGNGMGVAALVLGILACVLFWTVIGAVLLGLLAVVFGIIGARRGRRPGVRHRTKAVVGACLGALALLVGAVLTAFAVVIWKSDEFRDYRECLRHADTQSETTQCARDFGHSLEN